MELYVNNEKDEKLNSVDFGGKALSWREFDEDYALLFTSTTVYHERYKISDTVKLNLLRSGNHGLITDYASHVKFVVDVILNIKGDGVKFGKILISSEEKYNLKTKNDYSSFDLIQKLNELNIDGYRSIVSLINGGSVEDKFLHFKNEKKTLKK